MCAISNATFFSYSEIVIAPDVSSPVLGETAASGAWRGDRATVSGGFDNYDGWTTDWTDAENAPCAIGFRRERSTTFLILQ